MDRLWGISDPGFLALYVVLLAAPAGLSWFWADRQTRRTRGRAPAEPKPTRYHLAWMVGGAPRAVETAIALLLDRGYLRVDRSGTLHRTSGSATRTDHFERRVLDVSDDVSSETVIQRIRKLPECVDLGDTVERGGFVVPADHMRLRHATVLGLYVVVLGVGLVRLIAGIDGGHGDSLLALLLVPAMVAVVLSAALLVRARPRRTIRGRRELGAARDSLMAREPFTSIPTTTAVLFGGLAAHPERSVRTALSHSLGGGRGAMYAYGYNDMGHGGGDGCGASCGSGGSGGCGGGGGGP